MEKYAQRLNDIVILQLDTQGFDNLSEQQKMLSYHLSQAGLWGRFISLDQSSIYNIPLFNALIELYQKTDADPELHEQIHQSLFILFAHNGIYHSMSGEKLTLPLKRETLQAYKKIDPELIERIQTLWFDKTIAKFRTVQTDGVDVIAQSGGNFYHKLNTEEVNQFRKMHYPQVNSEEVPPFGFNERLVKTEQGIERQIISEHGLYGQYIKKIIHHLSLALEFSENQQQHQSISTLIDFYRSGDAFDFDKHCVAWTQDKDSDIYFINGLIESYEDPMGIGCTFESVVAFKNPLQTAKVNKIIENIQWFEDHLPFDIRFKKEKAVGLSASSINVLSMAGDTSPSLPLGVNLPNSDWIRKTHGSKSVNLANVASSRSTYEVQLRHALFLPQYHDVLQKYENMTNSLHTDLHEIAGHGSGKLLEQVSTDAIGAYYSTIEEARADLVALYYIAEPNLKTFGVYNADVDVKDAALAQYVSYLTNGAIGQLRRVELGNDLTQAHFRNRQLIASWVLAHGDKNKVRMVQKDGAHYVEVLDIEHVKTLFGALLSKVQEIKSTGDFQAAKELVMTYGTKVNPVIHQDILSRMQKLDMPKVVGFITPMLIKKNNTVVVEQSCDFFAQQMELHHQYYIPSVQKKLKPY